MVTTRTESNVPIYGALGALQSLTGAESWNAVTPAQSSFLLLERAMQSLLKRIPELASVASRSPDEVNAFLLAHGSTLQLTPWDPIEGCGSASVLDLTIAWATVGDRTTVMLNETRASYPAVHLSPDAVVLHDVRTHEHRVAEIATQSADRVFVTMADLVDESLLSFVTRVQHSLGRGSNGGLVLPMLSVDRQEDLSWLLGLHTHDAHGPIVLTQALQQTRFRLNERGARAQSAAAVSARRGVSHGTSLFINQPFVLWITRPSFPEPLFAGHFCPDAWKDPGSIV